MEFVEFSFIWNFHGKKCVVFSLTSFDTLKYDCIIKTIEILIFLSLINSSVTTGFSFFVIDCISNHIIKTINPSQDSPLPTSFSPVTSTNVGITPQTF